MKLFKWKEAILHHAYKKKAKAIEDEGYAHVSGEDIQGYFENYKWKKSRPHSLSRQLDEVKALTANQYFDYEQLDRTILHAPSLDEMDIHHIMNED